MSFLEPLTRAAAASSSSPLVPPATGKAVVRTALLNRLCGTGDGTIVTIVAPAGFGKTTLLAQWAERDRRPVLWIDLEPEDDDPRSSNRDSLRSRTSRAFSRWSTTCTSSARRQRSPPSSGCSVRPRTGRASRSRRAARRRCPLPACGRRAACSRSGWTSSRSGGARPRPCSGGPGCCSLASETAALGGAARRLAGRSLPRRAVAAERRAGLDRGRRRPLSRRLPRHGAPRGPVVRAAEIRDADVGPRGADVGGVRLAPRSVRLGTDARDPRARRRGRPARSPPAPLPLPTHRPRPPLAGARAIRAGTGARTAPCRGGPGPRDRGSREGARACGGGGRRRPRRRSRRAPRHLGLRTRQAGRARALARPRARGRRGEPSRPLHRRVLAARPARASRQRAALGRYRDARARRRRSSPLPPARAPLPRRRRPDARRHQRRVRGAPPGHPWRPAAVLGRAAALLLRRRHGARGERARAGDRARHRGRSNRADDPRPLSPLAARRRGERAGRRRGVRRRGGRALAGRAGPVARRALARGGRSAERRPARGHRRGDRSRWSAPTSSSSSQLRPFRGSPPTLSSSSRASGWHSRTRTELAPS